MKTEGLCREWRQSLGAYALGHLPAGERAGLEAHLEGCPECSSEARSLTAMSHLLPLADPKRFSSPAPHPPRELGERVAATIRVERKTIRKRRQRRRFGLAFGGAVAAAAAVLAIFVLPATQTASPQQEVAFASLPAGVQIDATLAPHAYGTEIHMYVKGIRSGTLCQVFLRGRHGAMVSAGSFRYRWDEDAPAVLSSALDLSRTKAIGVRAGNQTFIAPIRTSGSTADTGSSQGDVT